MSSVFKLSRFQTALASSAVLLVSALSTPYASFAQQPANEKRTAPRKSSAPMPFETTYSSDFYYSFAINPAVEKEIIDRFHTIVPDADIVAASIHQNFKDTNLRYSNVEVRFRDGERIDVELGDINGLFPVKREISLHDTEGWHVWSVGHYHEVEKWEGFDRRNEHGELPAGSALIDTSKKLADAAMEILSSRKFLSTGSDFKTCSGAPPADGLDNSTYTNSGKVGGGLGIAPETQQQIIKLLNRMETSPATVTSVSLEKFASNGEAWRFIVKAELSDKGSLSVAIDNPAVYKDYSEITIYRGWAGISVRPPNDRNPNGSLYDDNRRTWRAMEPRGRNAGWRAHVAERALELSDTLFKLHL